MTFTCFVREDDYSHRLAQSLIEKLTHLGWIYEKEHPDFVLSIGGDGTLLRAIHQYYEIDPLFVGLHTGTLGFLTDFSSLDDLVESLCQVEPMVQSFPLLELMTDQGLHLYAFNEFRIESLLKTLRLSVYIDGEFFEKTNSSGICLASQMGSTAINRALGGAVVDDGIQILQLNEILPITHNHHHALGSPYIMRYDRRLKIVGSFEDAYACFDHLNHCLEGVKEVEIGLSEKKVRFARYKAYSYLERLKNLY